ncbi:MAG TPA: CBS domain-containing protein [Egibacteraceae bacterium]|nr:CBS domain-containing protein [Egibacteraceae bacterium]
MRISEEGSPMRVRDWMSPDPITVTPFTDVAEARRLLHRYGIRHLPVVDHGRVAGIISDRDVQITDAALDEMVRRTSAPGRAVPGEAVGEGVSVGTVMSSPAHMISDGESVEAASRLMLSRRISALPVIGDDGDLLGIITTTDCLLASLTPQHAM